MRLVAGVPHALRILEPGLALEDHIQHHVDVDQHPQGPYFRISSSSRMRPHSSSLGAGRSDFNSAMASSAEYPASGAPAPRRPATARRRGRVPGAPRAATGGRSRRHHDTRRARGHSSQAPHSNRHRRSSRTHPSAFGASLPGAPDIRLGPSESGRQPPPDPADDRPPAGPGRSGHLRLKPGTPARASRRPRPSRGSTPGPPARR